MEATPYRTRPQTRPLGNALQRGLAAVFREHRMPDAVSLIVDRCCKRIGMRRKTVTVDGITMRLRRLTQDGQFVQNIIVNKEYNPPGYAIGSADTVIDIGANIGSFSLLAARDASRGRIFAFEPCGENYALLLQNIDINRATNIYPSRTAILDERKETTFYLARSTGGHTVLEAFRGVAVRQETVQCVRLQDVFDDNQIERCDFLKLDCEGAEFPIMFNLPEPYFHRIEKVVMEYHAESHASKATQGNAMVRLLQSKGFVVDSYLDSVGYLSGFICARRLL